MPGPAMFVHRAAVDPEVQRTGVAIALLEQAAELAREKGLPALRLDTYCENSGMRRLLEKLRFCRTGEFRQSFRPRPFFAYELAL